jgi:hypothetical protein
MQDEQREQQSPFDKHIDAAIEAQDGKTSETPATETPSGEQKPSEEQPQQQPQDRTSGTGDGTAQPKPAKKEEEAQQPAHAPKDLKLGDGTVIKAGSERRFYEGRELARAQLQQERQTHNATKQQLERLQTELETTRTSVQQVHGVSPQQLALGVRIVQDLQRDPQGTLRKLLEEAGAQGYSLEGIGSGVDMAAIRRMIDERIPQPGDNLQSDQDILAEANSEADAFFGRHPDARPHDQLLASVLRDHPDLDLEDAYFQVKNAFIEKGFDWNLPLEENLKRVDPANANGSGNRAPLPGGGNSPHEIRAADLTPEGTDDMDTGDIVKAAMREAGMKI